MKNVFLCLLLLAVGSVHCSDDEDMTNPGDDIQGFDLLTELNGHWVGSNQTAFGFYDWFAFDFRPISASHLHSIYEGGSNQNIITSVFVADFEGRRQIMARNGGWLGNQYRATYFVLDRATDDGTEKYYRLVDAVGKENRAYMEFRFAGDTLRFDAYKDNSGTLDAPIRHMGFTGTNYNPQFSQAATELFDFPQAVAEVNLEGRFVNLIDPDSALFLEEENDPFPKSQHGHVSDLRIDLLRDVAVADADLLLYLSTEPLINAFGFVDFENLDRKVVRTIDIQANESTYTATYLHPGTYYLTAFSDEDDNLFPSAGDVSSVSQFFEVRPERVEETSLRVDMEIE